MALRIGLDAVIDPPPSRPYRTQPRPLGLRQFEVAYTAVQITMPERMRFRYRLVGYDADWREAGGRRKAAYAKVPPGRYSFEVQAAFTMEYVLENDQKIQIGGSSRYRVRLPEGADLFIAEGLGLHGFYRATAAGAARWL